jgi:hypothetical protein
MGGIAIGLEPQPGLYALLRITRVSSSESRAMSDAQLSAKHTLISFSGD